MLIEKNGKKYELVNDTGTYEAQITANEKGYIEKIIFMRESDDLVTVDTVKNCLGVIKQIAEVCGFKIVNF